MSSLSSSLTTTTSYNLRKRAEKERAFTVQQTSVRACVQRRGRDEEMDRVGGRGGVLEKGRMSSANNCNMYSTARSMQQAKQQASVDEGALEMENNGRERGKGLCLPVLLFFSSVSLSFMQKNVNVCVRERKREEESKKDSRGVWNMRERARDRLTRRGLSVCVVCLRMCTVSDSARACDCREDFLLSCLAFHSCLGK